MPSFLNRRRFLTLSAAGAFSIGALPTLARAQDAADEQIDLSPSRTTDEQGSVYRVWVKLREPKKGSDKRAQRPLDHVSASLFVPKGVTTLRGAVLNPFYEPTVGQKHWRAAASLWGFGVCGINLFGVRGEQLGVTVLDALKALAKFSGGAEVEHLPLCLVGMSAGGGMSVRIAEAIPQRIIAAGPVALEVGPRDEASARIPMITIFGERDGKQMEKLLAKLPEARANDALWAIAVQWGRKHEFARANNLLMPLFEHAIAARYPKDASPAKGPVKLKDIDPATGWLGEVASWRTDDPRIAFAGRYDGTRGDVRETCWLLNEHVAMAWRGFVTHESKLTITDPPGQGDGAPFKAYKAGEPITVSVKADPALADASIGIYDGATKLGVSKGSPPTLVVPKLDAGVHPLIAIADLGDGKHSVSRVNTIVVAP